MKIKIFFFLITIIILLTKSYTQVFSTGEENALLKWKVLSKDNFNYYFPEEFKEKILIISKYTDSIYPIVFSGFKTEKKINFIYHTRTSISNGMTLLGPKRIEIFSFPETETYAQPYFFQLQLHELRHAAQLRQINNNFVRIISWFTGEQAPAFFFGLFVPRWFFEGDAVYAETKFSNSGRGKLPLFVNKSIAYSKTNLRKSYDQITLGSYKKINLPDNYEIGYHLVNKINKEKDKTPEILNTISANIFRPNAFNYSLKKATKQTKSDLFKNVIDSLSKINEDIYYSYHTIIPSNYYSSFYSPHWLNDSEIVALKVSYNELPAIVKTKINGKIKTLKYIELPDDKAFNYNNNTLIFTQTTQSSTYPHKSFSDVFTFDLTNNKIVRRTYSKYIQSPDISSDMKKILYIEYLEDGTSQLIVKELITKQEILIYKTFPDEQINTPIFSPDSNIIACLLITNNQKKLRIFKNFYDKSNIKYYDIIFINAFDLFRPKFIAKDKLLILISYKNTKQDIFLIDLTNKTIKQITKTRFGISNFDYINNKICFSELTPQGYTISSTDLNTYSNIPLDSNIKILIVPQNKTNEISNLSNDTNYSQLKIKSYNHLLNLFSFHSYAPFHYETDFSSANIGSMLLSQNILSTSLLTISYYYKLQKNKHNWKINYEYLGLPIKTALYANISNYMNQNEMSQFQKFLDKTFTTEFYTHYYFSQGINKNYLKISFNQSFLLRENMSNNKVTSVYPTTFEINYSFKKNKAIGDIENTLLVNLNTLYRATFFGKTIPGNQFYLNFTINLPSFLKTHFIKIFFETELKEKENKNPSFINLADLPEGYEKISFNQINRNKIEYYMPLTYPDFKIGGILYIKRIFCNVFYDFAYVKNPNGIINYNSEGLYINTDVHFLRTIFPLRCGIGFIYPSKLNTLKYSYILKLLLIL